MLVLLDECTYLFTVLQGPRQTASALSLLQEPERVTLRARYHTFCLS